MNDITDMVLTVHWVGRGELPRNTLCGLSERGVHVLRSPTAACPPARIAFAERAAAEVTAHLQGRRTLVLHSNPEQASLLAWALAARGADARSYPDATSLLADAASMDADVVLVDEADLLAGSWEHVRVLWQHLRVRWIPCLLTPANLLRHGDAAELDGLCVAVHALAADHDRCVAEAREPRGTELPLASLGPARTLRALLEGESALAAEFVTARLTVEVDLAHGTLLGARGRFCDGASIELLGTRALAALLEEVDGKVRIHAARAEPLSNLMASFESALSAEALARATTTEGSVMLLLANPSASGIRPVSVRDGVQQEVGEDELEDPTRVLSEHSVMALVMEQRALESASPDSTAAPQPVLPAAATRRARHGGFARVASSLTRALLTLAALYLAGLSAATLWEEYRPVERSVAPAAKRKQTRPTPASPKMVVLEPPTAAAPPPVVTPPAEPVRDPRVAQLVRRANDLRRRHRLSRARSQYERALELAPDDLAALAGLARTALDQGDLAAALSCAQKLVALDPSEENYRVLLARAEKRAPSPAAR